MGNGAGVGGSVSSVGAYSAARYASPEVFAVLERKCRDGYFFGQHDEYVQYLRDAIAFNALDWLELLLIAGEGKNAQPLHMACKMGRIEPLELLLSAGYPGDAADKDGRTPLHWSATCCSDESGLCATLLILRYPALPKRYDRSGQAPIHLAAESNNPVVIGALMDALPEVTKYPNTLGETALTLARRFQCTQAETALTTRPSQSNRSSGPKSSSSNSWRNGSSIDRSPSVSADRIMAVWERFFENAFMRAGVSEDGLDLDDYHAYRSSSNNSGSYPFDKPIRSDKKDKEREKGRRSQRKTTSSRSYLEDFEFEDEDADHTATARHRQAWMSSSKATSSSYHQAADYSSTRSSKQFADSSPNTSSRTTRSSKQMDAETKSAKSSIPCKNDVDEDEKEQLMLDEWFDWIVCFDEQETEHNPYFIVHKTTKEKRWLEDYLAAIYQAKDYWFLREAVETVSSWPFPTDLREARGFGWMTCYNHVDNSSTWMNVVTGVFESFLPIGYATDDQLLQAMNMCKYPDDLQWVEADQTGTLSWTVIIIPDEADGSSSLYYANGLTGQTSWTPPPNWQEKVEPQWNGWTLCAMENDPDNQFWYNFATGESVWVQ